MISPPQISAQVILWWFAGTDNDLEYYVRECGAILGVTRKLPSDKTTGKHILEYIFAQLVEFKKSSQVRGGDNG